MPSTSRSLHRQTLLFRIATAGVVGFFLLTAIAMLLFPGGTVNDPHTHGYSFFMNPLSDLGQTRTADGTRNTPSMLLFVAAMIVAAIAMTSFFLGLGTFLASHGKPRHYTGLGAGLGIVSGLCFAGVGLTPWNLFLGLHMKFVVWAFRYFLAAVVLNFLALLTTPGMPRRFAGVFAIFACLLLAYILLLSFGPSFDTVRGIAIQTTGQKIIVASALLTVLVQSLGISHHLRSQAARREHPRNSG